MKIAVIGGGPSGLYFALLAKQGMPHARVEVIEQNPRDATYGFGIVLADSALQQFMEADPNSHARLVDAMCWLRDQRVLLPTGEAYIDGNFSAGAIARLTLLQILEDCARQAGVAIRYEERVESLHMLANYDLIVGADGANSVVRAGEEQAFGTQRLQLTNRFAWYGTRRVWSEPQLSFKRWNNGAFVGHYYQYAPALSTFVAECDERTWTELGLGNMNVEELRTLTETVFAEELSGETLISNNSVWRQFTAVTNANWSVGNRVLIGDALASAHFSIGSGTRLALIDALALANAVCSQPSDVQSALARFEAERRPRKDEWLRVARRSYLWYEGFRDRLDRSPHVFSYDFLMRTGRITEARLKERSPRFAAALVRERTMLH